jgi:hypothetical protein
MWSPLAIEDLEAIYGTMWHATRPARPIWSLNGLSLRSSALRHIRCPDASFQSSLTKGFAR